MTTGEASQARILARLLVGREASDAVVTLYARALQSLPPLSSKDERLISLMVRHPWCAALLDGGLGWRRPNSEVRRRALVMLAILETQPELADMFIPKQRLRAEWLTVLWSGTRAVWCAGWGALLLWGLGA